jgi:hypothetical protein
MSPTARKTLNDDFIDGMSCAICGCSNLKIVHIEVYPDFVLCEACDSAFVVGDEGNWVMYGKIASDYPKTRGFAHRRWTWLQAVAEHAEKERSEWEVTEGQEDLPPAEIKAAKLQEKAAIAAPIPETAATSLPQGRAVQGPPSLGALLRKVEQAEKEAETVAPEPLALESKFAVLGEESQVEAPQAFAAAQPDGKTLGEAIAQEAKTLRRPEQAFEEAIEMELEEEPLPEHPSSSESAAPFEAGRIREQELAEPAPIIPEVSPSPFEWKPAEPDSGKRYRVTVRGDQLKHPKNLCAHCLGQPYKEFAIPGSLPDVKNPGKRRRFAFDLPLCRDCMQRTKSVSEEEKNARLLAKLVSGLIALISMVALLAMGLVKLDQYPLAGIFFLLSFAALSYTVPSLLLHNRANRYPPPEDAAFVLTTLLIEAAGEGETKFEWRNPQYAQLFQQVNYGSVVGEIELIEDRFARAQPQHPENIETLQSTDHPQTKKTPEDTDFPKSSIAEE